MLKYFKTLVWLSFQHDNKRPSEMIKQRPTGTFLKNQTVLKDNKGNTEKFTT